MEKAYTELVLDGSFALVKGFLLGFRCGCGNDFSYFFHHKYGIRRDTLGEMVKEALELDNYTHLCLENDVVESFKEAVSKVKPLIGLSVINERPIKGGRFDFSFTINNREAAERVKERLSNPPAGVRIEGYEPKEVLQPEVGTGIGGYAPLHPYSLRGSGTISGDFGGVMELFLKAKRMPDSELVLLSDIVLGF